MEEEFQALANNKTWTLVPITSYMNVVGYKWVYISKLKVDGSLDRLKSWLVAKGFNQVDGVDFSATFSHVVRPTTIRVVLTLAIVRQ